MPWLLVAQAESLAGSSGWAGAGLLGLVLAWLLFWHLPTKDKQITDLLGAKDKQIADLAGVFKSEATAERLACEKHFETLAHSINTAFNTLGNQLQSHSTRNQQWLDLLKSEIDARRKGLER